MSKGNKSQKNDKANMKPKAPKEPEVEVNVFHKLRDMKAL